MLVLFRARSLALSGKAEIWVEDKLLGNLAGAGLAPSTTALEAFLLLCMLEPDFATIRRVGHSLIDVGFLDAPAREVCVEFIL